MYVSKGQYNYGTFTKFYLLAASVCSPLHLSFGGKSTKASPLSKATTNILKVSQQKLVTVEEVQRSLESEDLNSPLHTVESRQAGSPWWFANIKRQGTVPWGNTSYILFRNVKDFGAIGTFQLSTRSFWFLPDYNREWGRK
jgi:hypothetical protein